ncbi:MAG: hypothetical protein ABIG73_02225, partial [Patescibacteria group bacterium]
TSSYTYPTSSYTYPTSSYTYPTSSYTYPTSSYTYSTIGYNYPSTSYPTTYAETIANVSTGPEGALPLILFGGLALSAVIYFVSFKIRFRKQNREIKQKEIMPDTDIYEYQF